MSQRVEPVATIDVAGVTKAIADGSLTLDARNAPYATATVELDMAQLSQSQIDWLDPVDDRRPLLVLYTVYPSSSPKSMYMQLRARVTDAGRRRVILTLESDEAILQNYAPMGPDNSGYYLAASARDVVLSVLDLIYTGTTPTLGGTADASLEPYWDLTNYIVNPSVSNTTFGFSASLNTSAINFSTAVGGALSTTSAIRWTASAADARVSAGTYTASEQTEYEASCYVRSDTTARSMAMMLIFKDSEDVTLRTVNGSSVTDTNSSWATRISVTGTAPRGTAKVTVVVRAVTTGVGQFHYADCFMLYESETPSGLQDYFDGSIASTGYTTAWEDNPGQSQSYRVAIVDRPLEAVIWQAGQTAWDFLMPLLASVNLILWCDEFNAWHLDEPADRAIASTLTVDGDVARSGDDRITLSDRSYNVTGVIVRYAWIQQRTGRTLRRTSTAGTAGNVLVIELAQPYPGPGTAAAILARRAGTGRAQSVDVVTDYSCIPGWQMNYTLPGAGGSGVVGQITAITYDVRNGFMQATAGGVVD